MNTLQAAGLFCSRSRTAGPSRQTSATQCFKSKARLFSTRNCARRLASLPGCMRLAIGLLVIGMGVTPLLLAIDHDLRAYRIGVDLAAMTLGAPLALACRLAADALVRAELRGLERLRAEAATTGKDAAGGIIRDRIENRSLEKTSLLRCFAAPLLKQSQDIETAIESFTASSPMELPAPAAPPPGALGAALTRRKWPRFSPPLTERRTPQETARLLPGDPCAGVELPIKGLFRRYYMNWSDRVAGARVPSQHHSDHQRKRVACV